MKKILLAILIALLVILACQIDFGEVVDKLSIIKKDEIVKDCPIFIDENEVHLGMTESQLNDSFGKPCDVLLSEYGFNWNIYHENFKNYIQVGVKDGVVVGMYTNSPNLWFENVTVGTKKEDVTATFGKPLNGIIKGNTRFLSNGSEKDSNFETYKIRGAFFTIYTRIIL